MPRRVAVTNLNATTLDILNVIRANADSQYQSLVPVVEQDVDIPRVGEVLYGYPALANQFINALVNRIAQVRVKSAQFNNAYANLKKGYLEFGETVEEVFVNITKARTFDVEKAAGREFKRTVPDIKSAFHTMNWRVQYPITIQNEDLRMAFLSFTGVEDLIARIVSAVNTAAEYDEFLLFKYLIIKGVTSGKCFPVGVDTANLNNAAISFRGYSNKLPFMSDKYNAAKVQTTTPKDRQLIFMDSFFNAEFDVNVLASAFNMDKAEFMGRLYLIDDFTSFDNDRFNDIRADSTMIEEVTEGELELMRGVMACIFDEDWFQVYDELSRFSETYVASGLYWNYFYNVWKTVSTSPFANAIVFVDNNVASTTLPGTITFTVTDKTTGDGGTTIVLTPTFAPSLAGKQLAFAQTEGATTAGVGVQPYGAFLFPKGASAVQGEVSIGGELYRSAASAVTSTLNVGATVEFTAV